jgi:ABC-type nitrate/sulfonate/bicarbonate transport system ATPase subunit
LKTPFKIKPRIAIASQPATRETVLLMPEAMPALSWATAAIPLSGIMTFS